ncbi:hypothetical protein FEM48_Zijuj09G0069200 [Ziziphus jujuba var. spinosa]|uniref:Uncharacterized protein n=1 Tax=Ziziphus jujuba var. spinosa TaxID=714518 RepID=A0A978URH9_ZIZJJ|nr:hypothetical protein FEM48_Zijuj09G0069200 [Ziziphus jujuba var. spinosa]
MKRRSQIPTTSRSFQEASRSDSQIPASISPRSKDLSRKKRVRFKDLDDAIPCRADNDSVHVEAVQPLTCDGAKTSEYAFFKKLKKDAGHELGSHPLNNDSKQIQAKTLKSVSCFGERTKIVDDSCNKGIKYSFPVEKATPVNFYSFDSSLGNALKNSDVIMEKGWTKSDHLHRIHEDMEEDNNALKPDGTKYRHAETFIRKRQKLCQWVAATSYPDMDGIYSKGYNIISALLGRLVPKSSENNNLKEQKVGQMETNAKSSSLVSSESDIDCVNIQLTPTRKLVEHECGRYFVDSISSSWANRSGGGIPYLDSDSPTRYANETQHHCRIWESDSALRGGISTLCAESDFTFPISKYGSVSNLKELDLFCHPNRYLVGRELDMPMLDWDFDNIKDEKNLSLAHNHEYGRHLLEGKDDIIPDPSHLPLTLSCTPNHFTAKDCHNDNGSDGGSNFFTPHHNNWFMSKVIKEGHDYPNTEALLSSELVLDLGLKCFPLTGFPKEHVLSTDQALQFPGMEDISSHLLTYDGYDSCLGDTNHTGTRAHFSEDNLSIHDYPSFEFQLFQDREQTWPLLLDKSSQDGVEECMDFGNCKLNYI